MSRQRTNFFSDAIWKQPKRELQRALRVGYLSHDWSDHPMGRLTSYFVTHHRSQAVQSYAFSYGPDRTKSLIRQRVRRRVEASCGSVVQCSTVCCSVVQCSIICCHVKLCDVMLCVVMSYHVMLCVVISCHVMSCHVMSCHVMSCHVMSCHVMLFGDV